MARLGDLARLVRAKNAGPFWLTIDILFTDPAHYRLAAASPALSSAALGRLYRTPPEHLQVFHCEEMLAIKVSLPRPVPAGDPADPDVFGGQQHGPLVDLDLGEANRR